MKKLIHLLKSLLCNSVDQTLNGFQKKINSLNKRVDLCAEKINATDDLIEKLNKQRQVLESDISKAENAIEFLNKING